MWWVPTPSPSAGRPTSDQLLIPYPIASPPTQHKLLRLPQPLPSLSRPQQPGVIYTEASIPIRDPVFQSPPSYSNTLWDLRGGTPVSRYGHQPASSQSL